ncbi:hypothetical protein C0991_004502, partial [Blastosporella zonata]
MSAIHNAEAIFDLPAPQQSSGLPVPNSTHSFWINTPGANPLAKEGSEDDLLSDADVCIIGSGITGVSAAYHLAKSLVGKEGAAESRYGSEEAKKAHKLEIHTERELVDLIKAEGWESLVDLVSSHRVGLLRTDKEFETTKADYDAAKAASADLIEQVEWLDKGAIFE